jgi:hypothetical protein
LDVSHALDTDSKRSCPLCIGQKPWSFLKSTIRFFPEVKFAIVSPYEQYMAHFSMLFYQVKHPWSLPKYEKRVRRLFSIFVLFLFSRRSFFQYGNWSTRTFRDRLHALTTLVLWFNRMRTNDKEIDAYTAASELPRHLELSGYLLKVNSFYRKEPLELADFYVALEQWIDTLCTGRTMHHYIVRTFRLVPNITSIIGILTIYRENYELEQETLLSLVRQDCISWALQDVPLVPELMKSFVLLYQSSLKKPDTREEFRKLLSCVIQVLTKFEAVFVKEILFLTNGIVFNHVPHDPSTLTNNMP